MELKSFLRAMAPVLLISGGGRAFAGRPTTPIHLELKLTSLDASGGSGELRIDLCATEEGPGTRVELLLPDGLKADPSSWMVDLKPESPLHLNARWWFEANPGNLAITARARRTISPTESWGDIASIRLRADPQTHVIVEGWEYPAIPVMPQLAEGNVKIASAEELPWPSDAAERAALTSLAPGAHDLTWAGSPPVPAAPPVGPLLVTITGRMMYPDRSNVEQPVQDSVIELRRGDGTALPGSNFCFTNYDGYFSCAINHPGTAMRVRTYPYTVINPNATRLGVFTPSCGDSVGCAWPQDTGSFTCPDGATCNIGTFGGTPTEPHRGAMQMEQDMVRAFKTLSNDTLHAPLAVALPGRIVFPSAVGPVYTRGGNDDDWISIPYPFQTSADVVTHEYGHSVMRHLWANFTPAWPIQDCPPYPAPHYINRVSGNGCALSEGFGDFWSWYGNQSYDGDNNPANDGPIYDDPSFTSDMETRGMGSYDAGDQVEGNVAAVLGDLLDAGNDGPTPGAADRVTDGIQHIWHVFSSQSVNYFVQWYDAYRALGHDPGPILAIAEFNTFDYTPFSVYYPEDICASALPAQPTPWSKTLYAYHLTSDSTDPFPPCGNGNRAGSIFYTFVSGPPGLVAIDTFGSSYDTILSVWTGGCGGLIPVAGGCNDDAGGGAQSQLSFNAQEATLYTIMVSSYTGTLDYLTLHVGYSVPPPAHDLCSNAKVIPSAVGGWSDVDWTHGATTSPADPQPSCTGPASGRNNTVWYRFTAPWDGRLAIQALNGLDPALSSYDPVISTYVNGCDPSLRAAAPGGCNDDISQPGTAAGLVLEASKGRTYHFMVSSFDPGGGKTIVSTNFVPAGGRVQDLDARILSNGQLGLTWSGSCMPFDTNFNVYEGTIGSYYSHTPLSCGTGGSNGVALPMPSGNRYYLISPIGYMEGSLGTNSQGVEIPRPAGSCWAQDSGQCAPACAHDACIGNFNYPPLDPACSDCVAKICADYPSCCSVEWDGSCVYKLQEVCRSLRCDNSQGSCAHNLCAVGGVALTPGCDPVGCVASICAVDPSCCNPFPFGGFWSQQCATEVYTVCGYNCN